VLYRWEIILRESAIFGILGILTLGYYVDAAIAEIRLDVAMVLILATALLSMAVDALSRGLRRRLRIDTMPTRLSDAPSEMRLARPAGAEQAA
jgi:phosphonate transport system permease protein